MTGSAQKSAKEREREARDLEDIAEVECQLAGRPDLAAATRAVAQELREEGNYLAKKGEGQNADPGC